MASSSEHAPLLPGSLRARLEASLKGLLGWFLLALCLAAAASLVTWSATDPSLIRTAAGATRNALGAVGANFADLAMRLLGLAAVFLVLPPLFWALQLITRRSLEDARLQLMLAPPAVLLLACAASALPRIGAWPLPYGLGGFLGDLTLRFLRGLLGAAGPAYATPVAAVLCLAAGATLLTASLGMSLRDVWLVCQVERPRFQLIRLMAHGWARGWARGWGRLLRAGERDDPAYVRREPTFDMSASPFAGRTEASPRVEPAFDYEPPIGPGQDTAPPPGKRVNLRRPVREPEFDDATDAASRAMARRFAPPPGRDEPSGAAGFGLLRRHWPPSGRTGQRRPPSAGEGQLARGPVWPGSVPTPVEAYAPPTEPEPSPEPYPPGDRDELYGRAVALVRAHRKASTAYLQQSLGIRYMRAADLIDRMEREGIVGAPVHGTRPILGSRVV